MDEDGGGVGRDVRDAGAEMRRVVVLAISLGCLPLPAQAEITVIYRKSDKLVAGWVQPPQSVQQEIENVTRSELGGSPADYATAPLASLPEGHRPVIKPNGTATIEEYPSVTKKKQDQQAGKGKLKALGLTDDEIAALVGR